jgi:predicted pyridoxine 5'-phosphate oxidase superfamily flavin-nucleotide-binding protein
MIAHVVRYGMIDGLGNNAKTCLENLLNDLDYVTDLGFFVNGKITKGIQADQTQVTQGSGIRAHQPA